MNRDLERRPGAVSGAELAERSGTSVPPAAAGEAQDGGARRSLDRPAKGWSRVLYGVAFLMLVGASLESASLASGLPATEVVGYDFGAYYHAAEAIRDGVSPYFPETVAGPFPLKVSWYLYPPPFAAAMLPFAFLPAAAANICWSVLLAIGTLVIGATIGGAGNPRAADPRIAIVVALALGLSVPGISGSGQGAVSVMLGVFGLAPLLATGAPRLSGVLTALAALAKIEPALWAMYLAGAGRIRALVIAAGTGLLIIVGTFAFPGVRAGWAEYPRVLVNAAASDRAVLGNNGIGALLGLAPGASHLVETALLIVAAALMLLAGRGGMRFAPLASGVGLLATPTLWSHSVFLVVPGALAVVALGSGISVRIGTRRVTLSGLRFAELFAMLFFLASYVLFFGGLDRFLAYLLVLPIGAAAAVWGPSSRVSATAAATV